MPFDGNAQSIAERLVAEFFSVSGGILHIAGRPVSEIAASHGTPLFVYDAGIFRSCYRRLAEAVGGFADICYSVKANPHPDVIRVFLAEGAGAEVASAGEFDKALSAGCAPGRILFAGPGKTDAELEHVLAAGIGEIHVESEGEIARLGQLARRLGCAVKVAIRVNPLPAGQGGSMLMGGRPTPFGIDEERLEASVRTVEAEEGLTLTGIHLFTGTQILDAAALRAHWLHGLEIARQVSLQIGRPLETIDLGGGLGIPYYGNEKPLDLCAVQQAAADLADAARQDPALAQARFVIEPGRFLAGPGGVYVVRVTDVKISRGERFIIVDGGMHHHLAASGNLGQVVKRDYPVVAASRMDDEATTPAAIVGPLCTPLDVLARRVDLPELVPGDLIAVLQSGAYALSASPVGFLSRPAPAEVVVHGENSPGPRATTSRRRRSEQAV